MVFASIDPNSLEYLRSSFESFLSEHNLYFQYVSMQEKEGILSFTFCNDPEKARSVEFEGKHLIGLDMDYIAAEILLPILPRLKAYAR